MEGRIVERAMDMVQDGVIHTHVVPFVETTMNGMNYYRPATQQDIEDYAKAEQDNPMKSVVDSS